MRVRTGLRIKVQNFDISINSKSDNQIYVGDGIQFMKSPKLWSKELLANSLYHLNDLEIEFIYMSLRGYNTQINSMSYQKSDIINSETIEEIKDGSVMFRIGEKRIIKECFD